jgi:hypothetical protein
MFGEVVRGVDAEAVQTALQPEPENLVYFGGDGGVGPVEVRLIGCEQVKVVLAGVEVERPGRSAEV